MTVDDLYSAFAAAEEVDALLPDIQDALDALDKTQDSPLSFEPEALLAISHGAIDEQIAKARRRIQENDFPGAIASVYTLVEQLLKLLLDATSTRYSENEGDIRSLYKLLRKPMQLDPAADGINLPLKPILDGLQKLVGGLYEIANKASDRHAALYNTSRHHAKLAVSAAFTLCEFLVESHEYQKSRGNL